MAERVSYIINNTYNPECTPVGIDIVNNREGWNSWEANSGINDLNTHLSEYFLTNKTLFTQMKNSSPYYLTSDGIFRRDTTYGAWYTELMEYLPVTRIYNPKKLYYKYKIKQQYGTGCFGDIGAIYIEDGVAKRTTNVAYVGVANDWTQGELDISEIPYIDYIWICWEDGDCDFKDFEIEYELPAITSNGGGATHIAKVTGQLKDLSSNLSDILMVSGGGGGGLLVGDTDYSGKEAGGISGSGDNSADQSTGNAFGLGESGTNVSGGGSGLYGGYKGTASKSGGAGSGYIGNSLLSNKKMVGYNVPTSSAEATKTESVNEVSASAVSGKPKSGNGFARITLKSLS